MSSGGGKAPEAPDPQRIIELQAQYNRYNENNPFGSSYWTTDENGHETRNTSANPQMQGAIDRAFAAAETPYQRMYVPQGMDQLASALMARVGAQHGLGTANPNNQTLGWGTTSGGAPMQGAGGALNTNLKQQQQSPMPPDTSSIQGPQGSSPWNIGNPQMSAGRQMPQRMTMGG